MPTTTTTTTTHPCANQACPNRGTSACKRCLLVAYCGKPCQAAHWPAHKAECGSRMAKPGWRPDWEERWIAHRIPPAWVGEGEPLPSLGGKRHLWGTMPAIDVVGLAGNEGVGFEGPINVLFAASGDIRNLIKSVVDLPGE